MDFGRASEAIVSSLVLRLPRTLPIFPIMPLEFGGRAVTKRRQWTGEQVALGRSTGAGASAEAEPRGKREALRSPG